jgi:AraC-like DNA-binding protein/CheY-like chemotaxis protein
MDALQSIRYRLRGASHAFIQQVLPWHEQESRVALEAFVREATMCSASSERVLPWHETDSRVALEVFVTQATICGALGELDVVLQISLNILDRHAGGQLPSLTDRYLSGGRDVRTCLDRFVACIESVLRYRGLSSPTVRQAIGLIEEQYMRPDFVEGLVARALGITPSSLSAAFKNHTGLTFGEYLRACRLDRAATLFRRPGKRIKEVWALCGYNHGSNFCHDFKERFGITARQYQSLVIPAVVADVAVRRQVAGAVVTPLDCAVRRVMIVDDHQGAQNALADSLHAGGYEVMVESTGTKALADAKRSPPDVALIEYHLPDMDGVDVCRSLRQSRGCATLPTAFVSGDVCLYDRSEEIHLLGGIVMMKPFDCGEAERAIEYLLSDRGGSQTRATNGPS